MNICNVCGSTYAKPLALWAHWKARHYDEWLARHGLAEGVKTA